MPSVIAKSFDPQRQFITGEMEKKDETCRMGKIFWEQEGTKPVLLLKGWENCGMLALIDCESCKIVEKRFENKHKHRPQHLWGHPQSNIKESPIGNGIATPDVKHVITNCIHCHVGTSYDNLIQLVKKILKNPICCGILA